MSESKNVANELAVMICKADVSREELSIAEAGQALKVILDLAITDEEFSRKLVVYGEQRELALKAEGKKVL